MLDENDPCLCLGPDRKTGSLERWWRHNGKGTWIPRKFSVEDNLRPPASAPLPFSRRRSSGNNTKRGAGCRVIYDSSFRLDGSRRIHPRNRSSSPRFLGSRLSRDFVNAVDERKEKKKENTKHVVSTRRSERRANGKGTRGLGWRNIFHRVFRSGQKRREREVFRQWSKAILFRPAIVTKPELPRGTNFTPKNARIKDKGREISRVKAA